MGFFDFLRGAKRAPIPGQGHPVFGKIQYVGHSTWEGGAVFFKPVNATIEVLVDAPESGPDERHIAFLHDVAARWAELMRAAEPLLRQTLQGWVKDAGTVSLSETLALETVMIRAGIAETDEWEMTFWCEEAGHWLNLSLTGWQPTSATVDG